MTPTHVIEARESVCRDSCKEQCAAYLASSLNHSDPHASCPRRGWILAWGCYGPCDGITPRDGVATVFARLQEPTIADLASNFGSAISRWTAAGFPTVDAEAYAARTTACDACPLWDAKARFGLGKCTHAKCGCTKMKRWLTTEKCPLGKWPAPTVDTRPNFKPQP